MTENSFSLTVIARIIGSIGIGFCVIFMNVLVFDRKTENFDNTKGIIQLFGLDVYDFESLKYNGLFTFGILAIIIVLNLLTNSLLILGTVMKNRYCSFPFLSMTALLTVAKILSVNYNIISRWQQVNTVYIISSSVFLVFLQTSWICVYLAQRSWKKLTKPDTTRINTTIANGTMNYSLFDSPGPYQCNAKYSEV